MNKTVLNLKVLTEREKFEIIGFDENSKTLKVCCRAKPVKGKANNEIEKELSKKFNAFVSIIFGKKSSNKKILVEKNLEEIKKLI